MLTALLLSALLPVTAMTSTPDVADLEKRLSTEGVESVNVALITQWPAALVTLNRRTAGCELPAVSLSARLSRGGTQAVSAHRESLRTAAGQCPGIVLALISVDEVPKICASSASWTITQMARELRRRMKEIDADEVLRASPRGKACRAAYLYELENTRVGLRVAPPRSASGQRAR